MGPSEIWIAVTEEIGEEAARRLATELPGETITIPSCNNPSRRALAPLAGMEGDPAGQLVSGFAGIDIYVPTLATINRKGRNERIREEAAAGRPLGEIAQREGLTVRHVRRIARGESPSA